MTAARTLSVAVDVGPLVGPPTGIGRFTAELTAHLEQRTDVRLIPYVLSFRAALPAGARRLKYPARLALGAWSRGNLPNARRSLRGADVVHGTNYVVPPTGWPTVVSVHDLTLFQRPELVLPVVRTFGSVIRRAVDKGAYVHTISQVVADEVKALLHTDRVRVVYPGPTYDPNQAPGQLPDGLVGRRFILSIGTREPRKNLPRLVAAFGQVHDQNHGIVLVLAGSPGTDDAAIADALGKLPHEAAENVRLLGYVDDATRAALFTHATVFAYPSLDEGFGLPLLEAMHYRVPIVTSTAGALPEIAADAALLVDPTDITATAHALHIALTDEPTRQRLVEAGTRRGRAFSWTTAADEMVALYHHVLEHS